MKKYDISFPKRRYWNTEIESPHLCPECQTPLVKDFQMYLLVVKQGKEVEPYLTGNEGGWFCPNCPVVVLDHGEFVNALFAVRGMKAKEFTVAGIVNSEAIPEEKKHLPLGDDDNPIPLVEFLNIETHRQENPKRRAITRKQRRQLKHHRKHKRKKK